MFDLSREQIAAVAGGGPTLSETLAIGGGIGGGVGASVAIESAGGTMIGVASLGSTAAITVFSAAGAGLVASGAAGAYVGGKINEVLPDSIKDAIGGTISMGIGNVESIASIVWKALRQSGFYGSKHETGAACLPAAGTTRP